MNSGVISVLVDYETSVIQVISDQEIYSQALQLLDDVVPADMPAAQIELIKTVKKEEAGRAALQQIVAELNKSGDYFTSVDQGIAGSELLWPIEAFMKRGFFVFAYRKFWQTIPPTGTTIYDQVAQDLMDSKIRAMALEYSGVDEATLDYIKTATTV